METLGQEVVLVLSSVLSAREMETEKLHDFLLVIHSVINNFFLFQLEKINQIAAFTLSKRSILVSTFIWKCTATPVYVCQLIEKCLVKIMKPREVFLNI